MGKGRLEAFSDGVIAIIITIMVLELKVPHGHSFTDLAPLAPVFLSYVLSFIYIAIYWNNHHHMLHITHHINGSILWANMHLLFWLSMVPFVTGWMGENHFESVPVALYGGVMLMASIAYFALAHCLVVHHEQDSELAKAIGKDRKGVVSSCLYAVAIPLAFWQAAAALALYVAVALIWFLPDRRIERVLR